MSIMLEHQKLQLVFYYFNEVLSLFLLLFCFDLKNCFHEYTRKDCVHNVKNIIPHSANTLGFKK